MRIFIPCVCMLITGCVVAGGTPQQKAPVIKTLSAPVSHQGQSGDVRIPPRTGGTDSSAVLHRAQIHVGDMFTVYWPLLKGLGNDGKKYGWTWTNSDALKSIIKYVSDAQNDDGHTFYFKALNAPGDQRIEFMNLRPGEAQSPSAEGKKAFYMTILHKN